MGTMHVFIIGTFTAAFFTSINATCPHHSEARCYGHIEIAKKERSVQSVGDDSGAGSSQDRSDAYEFLKKFVRHKNTPNVTWKVEKYSSWFSASATDKGLRQGFEKWAAVTPLRFEEIPKSSWRDSDIHIEFQPMSSFEVVNDYAVTTWPDWKCIIRFNDHKDWTLDSYDGSSFLEVATHEIGHALGLFHSNVPTAVMRVQHPSRGNPYFNLDPDDIAGIQALYGRPSANSGGNTNRATNWRGNQATNWKGNQATNWRGNHATNSGGNQATNWRGNHATNSGGNQATNWRGNHATNSGGNQATNWKDNHGVTRRTRDSSSSSSSSFSSSDEGSSSSESSSSDEQNSSTESSSSDDESGSSESSSSDE